MCLIRWVAGSLMTLRGRQLVALIAAPIAYLVLTIGVGFLIVWLKLRLASVDADTLLWQGEEERILFGVSVKHGLLFVFTVLPITVLDVQLVRRRKRSQHYAPKGNISPSGIRSALGWVGICAGNTLLPIALIVTAEMINITVFGGY
jgi:hypothetical protein